MERLLFLLLVLVMGLVRGNTNSCDEEPLPTYRGLPCVKFTECPSFVKMMGQYGERRNTTEGCSILRDLKARVCNKKKLMVFCPGSERPTSYSKVQIHNEYRKTISGFVYFKNGDNCNPANVDYYYQVETGKTSVQSNDRGECLLKRITGRPQPDGDYCDWFQDTDGTSLFEFRITPKDRKCKIGPA